MRQAATDMRRAYPNIARIAWTSNSAAQQKDRLRELIVWLHGKQS